MNIVKTSNKLCELQTICLRNNIAFVSYRLPFETSVNTLIQNGQPRAIGSLNNIEQSSGFLIAPFTHTQHQKSWLLEPDFSFVDDEISPEILEKFQQQVLPSILRGKKKFLSESTTRDEFEEQVEKAVQLMNEGVLNKVVLSKIRVVERNENFGAEELFQKLCESYPNAFVYMFQLPETGCWIGATPELLLRTDGGMAQTVSIAGTQIATDCPIELYQWSTKEMQEQGIVTDFVEQTLHNLGVKQFEKTGPVNIKAANLVHLKTAFEFKQSELKNRLGDFLNALHPTPSVGGLPKEESIDFILKNELHQREYYSGYLGLISPNQKNGIFVNLRCLQLFHNKFVLYSGAGITASSVARNEWMETENKMRTLLNVIES